MIVCQFLLAIIYKLFTTVQKVYAYTGFSLDNWAVPHYSRFVHCYLIATDIGIGHARIAMLIYLKMLKHTAVLAKMEVIMEIAKIDTNF